MKETIHEHNTIEIKESDPQRESDITQIKDFLFNDRYERIGADCSGDSTGVCAHSVGIKCHQFVNCQAASNAMGIEEICPSHVSPKEARKQAEQFYEKIKTLTKFHDINDTYDNYTLNTSFIDSAGEEIAPDFSLFKANHRGEEELKWFDKKKNRKSIKTINK